MAAPVSYTHLDVYKRQVLDISDTPFVRQAGFSGKVYLGVVQNAPCLLYTSEDDRVKHRVPEADPDLLVRNDTLVSLSLIHI